MLKFGRTWQYGRNYSYFSITWYICAEIIYSPELGEVLLILFTCYFFYVSGVLAQVPLLDCVGG